MHIVSCSCFIMLGCVWIRPDALDVQVHDLVKQSRLIELAKHAIELCSLEILH